MLRILLAIGGLILGLVLACALAVGLWRYVYLPAGCWRWDPAASWRPSAHCGTLGSVLKLVDGLAFLVAMFVPIVILGRRKS